MLVSAAAAAAAAVAVIVGEGFFCWVGGGGGRGRLGDLGAKFRRRKSSGRVPNMGGFQLR